MKDNKCKISTNGVVVKCKECGHTVLSSLAHLTGFSCRCEVEKEMKSKEHERIPEPTHIQMGGKC